MGIESVAVYSDADRDARFVLEADEAYRIGPAPAAASYLNQKALIETALRAGVQGIHPGYGFLSENAGFADAVTDAGLSFIGPPAAAMRVMGDKIAARRAASEAGVPVVPGTPDAIESMDQAKRFAAEYGLPLLVKAGGGGGGRGIRVVEDEDELEASLETAAREAGSYFSNSAVYLERFYQKARHIEVQVAGDSSGTVVAWGERDCSTQRRRQKLVEETPAPNLPNSDRMELLDAATRLAAAASYAGVGTVEFLYTGPGAFYFLEMNTRIQVEHTITEEVTGLDLVRESVQLALGLPATVGAESRGHAIEARINAEDPAEGFRPGPGRIEVYREPGGEGVRVDSGVYQGFTIPGDYDSLMAKVVVRAPTRERATEKMLQALRGYRVEGVPTTIQLIANIISSQTFRAGLITTDWLDEQMADMVGMSQAEPTNGNPETSSRSVEMEVNGKRFEVRLFNSESRAAAQTRPSSDAGRRRGTGRGNQVLSPMRGTVVSIAKETGDEVNEGEKLVVVEAMKMENEVKAPRAGRVLRLLVKTGETVESKQPLIELEA